MNLYGFKVLRRTDETGPIKSPIHNAYWLDPCGVHTITAQCFLYKITNFGKPPHKAPAIDCNCGIHATWKFADAIDFIIPHLAYFVPRRSTAPSWVPSWVHYLCLIQGWGTVIIGSKGFRSQHAKLFAVIGSLQFSYLAHDKSLLPHNAHEFITLDHLEPFISRDIPVYNPGEAELMTAESHRMLT